MEQAPEPKRRGRPPKNPQQEQVENPRAQVIAITSKGSPLPEVKFPGTWALAIIDDPQMSMCKIPVELRFEDGRLIEVIQYDSDLKHLAAAKVNIIFKNKITEEP